jgi:arylsulfatase A-like enzyme
MLLSRRHFISGSTALPLLAEKKPVERPSLLLLLADGLADWMVGCYGSKEVHTPAIDRLAQAGTRFLDHIVCSPVAATSRNTMLTGRTPMQLGAGETLSANEITLEKLLASAGYTCHTGAGSSGGQFLDSQAAGKPFLLTVNFTGLQPPYSGVPQKQLDLYAQARLDSFSKEQPAPNARAGKEMLTNLAANQRKAAAATSALDAEVQTVLSKLAERKLVDQTLVVFAGTCGSLLGRHGLWDAGLASDPPNMYDESVNTPLIWSWPGQVPAQAVRPEVVSSYDFLPTIADLLSIPPPARNLCGRSYALLATGKPLPKKQPWRTTVFGHCQNTEMARMDRYKLVLREQGKSAGELYDLKADPAERTNRYDDPQFLTVRNSLTSELAAWRQKYSS